MEDIVTEETTYQETQTNEFIFPEIHKNNEKHNNSIITFFHKITTNNVTRQGVTTIPSSSFVPLVIFAIGISSVTDFQFLDKMSDFGEFSSFENFPSLEEIERIDEIINMDMENITNFGEESIKMNNNNVPRSLY